MSFVDLTSFSSNSIMLAVVDDEDDVLSVLLWDEDADE